MSERLTSSPILTEISPTQAPFRTADFRDLTPLTPLTPFFRNTLKSE